MRLFRQEAVMGSSNHFAPIVIFNSKQFLHLFVATLALFVLLVGFILTQNYAQKIALNGRLSAHEVDSVLYADKPGYVADIHYEIGDEVAEGATILTYVPQQAFSNKSVTHIEMLHNEQQITSITHLEAQLNTQITAQSESVRGQHVLVDKQLQTLAKQIQHYRDQVQQLHTFHTEVTDLVKQGVLPKTHLLDSAQNLLQMKQLLADKQVQIDTLALQKAQITANQQLYLNQTSQTLEQYKNDKLRLSATNLGLQKQQLIAVKATRHGYVAALPKRPSEHFTPMTILTVIKPLEQHIFVNLYLPHSQKGKVLLGTNVNLELLSFTRNQFGFIRGKVVDIHQNSQANSNGLNFDTIVVRLPQQLPQSFRQATLQTGMLVEGNVLLKEQPIWRWCFQFVTQLFNHELNAEL